MHRGLYKFLTVMGGKFECQVQDSDLEYLLWKFDKHITLSENKLPFTRSIFWADSWAKK